MLHASLTIELSDSFSIAYMLLFVASACAVYLFMAWRASEEQLDRKVVDGIFFTILGVSAIIWALSKIPPIS
ncbi:MAG: hypothetical protein AAF927_05590 [Bacteroidota bacterium]